MHLVLNKKLIVDIANLRKRLMVTICTDATNYHDRVAHLFISLSTLYFRLDALYLIV